jgi:simple sugar transport system permease protein
MNDLNITLLLASIVASATPIVLASLGETLSEKAGVINLSLDGSILFSAMIAFVVALESQQLWLGFAAGCAAGALIAALVGLFSIQLGQSQVAVGFVLTLVAKDLAYFLGNPYSRVYGLQTGPWPIPGLAQIPFIGEIFFRHSLPVYFSMVLVLFGWWFIFKSPMGLRLRAVGENPQAAYARGIHPAKIQWLYTVLGGALVGLAGASFSLGIKPGWGHPQGAEGTGWIALAIVIFGGWHPIKVALGSYFFAFLQVMGIQFQNWLPSIPAQVFQVAPFPLMIFTLALIYFMQKNANQPVQSGTRKVNRLLRFLSASAPAALGKSFRRQ